MTASTLLARLTDRGVHLAAEAGSLVVAAPRGVLTDEDRDALRACKPELLALVAPAPVLAYETTSPWIDVATPEPADDWPEAWSADFADLVAENRQVGYPSGVAAALAYRLLQARAAAPWRAVVAAWSIEQRQRWGIRASELQDAGADWRDAERIAFGEIEPSTEESRVRDERAREALADEELASPP
jgi:hypothetical protein